MLEVLRTSCTGRRAGRLADRGAVSSSRLPVVLLKANSGSAEMPAQHTATHMTSIGLELTMLTDLHTSRTLSFNIAHETPDSRTHVHYVRWNCISTGAPL